MNEMISPALSLPFTTSDPNAIVLLLPGNFFIILFYRLSVIIPGHNLEIFSLVLP